MEDLKPILNEIKNAAKIAFQTPNEPEKKLRELVSPIWIKFLKEKRIGLNLIIRDELTLANGRADTVFNKLILEYKKPHSINPDNNKNRKLISQVQGYILDLGKKERFSKERLLGVVFDGNYFLFMRYAKGWRTDEPMPVNEKSLQLFLLNLEKLTAKKALIPENLIIDFAVGRESRNKVAVDCIKAFYNEINQHCAEGETKEHVFFEQWRVQFAEVHGSLEQKKIDTKTLFTSYGFSKKEQINFNVYAFFFALDSYYALLMKLLSYQVVGYYTMRALTGLPLHDWENTDSSGLKRRLEMLEEGGLFREADIRNFLEGDLFSWYTEAWKDEIYRAIKQIVAHLNDYDPETMEVAPDETRDILKKLYQYLVPKQIRHDLGEYYTPDWLAERCLNQLNYNGDPKYRILDPGCGSGTFLILAIKRAKKFAEDKNISPAETLKNILKNIYGFDLNPMAVISARTNYMLAIADLLKYKTGEITIPIYLCDSINPPEAKIDETLPLFPEKFPYLVKTSVGSFYFSHSIVTKHRVQQLSNILEDCVKKNIPKEDFMNRVKSELKLNKEEFEESELYLDETYDKLIDLEKRGINGVWARIIKNAFAPLFVGRFDLVVGNPPWVNWESLPDNYREETKPLWIEYGLFSLKGNEARLGGGKKDISMLMTYVSVDEYLVDEGKLCFVITQSIFKTTGAGDGFRNFKLGKNGKEFKIIQVDDMVELQPFEGASNRTSVFTCQKGFQTTYPLSYVLWRKKRKGRISLDLSFEEVINITFRSNLKAKPISKLNNTPWITGKGKTIDALTKIIKKSYYTAYEGANNGGVAGVYWISIKERKSNILLINNLFNVGKKIVERIECEIEEELVYPLLRWSDMKKWTYSINDCIIIPQDPKTRMGIDEKMLIEDLPMTYKYLKNFEDILWTRKSKTIIDIMKKSAFYAIFSIGAHSFSKYKVCWQTMGEKLRSTVVESSDLNNLLSTEKSIVPQHTIVFIPVNEFDEAHYLCSMLNNSISDLIARSYSMGKSFGNPHLMNHIPIPKYKSEFTLHKDLLNISIKCHEKVSVGIDVTDLEEQIDELAAELWGLTKQELRDIQESLEELR